MSIELPLLAPEQIALPQDTTRGRLFITTGGQLAVKLPNGEIVSAIGDAASIGLGNVNNTADVDKPVSTAQAEADAAVAAAAAADATAKAAAAQTASVPVEDFPALVQAQIDEALRTAVPAQTINVFRFDSTGAGPYSLPSLKPYDTAGWNLLFMGALSGPRDPSEYTLTSAQLTLGAAINNPATFPKGTLQYTVLNADITPDGFAFEPAIDVAASSLQTSNPVTINGISAPSPVSVTGGEYSVNGGGWTASPGTVVNGDTIRVRQTASTTGGTTTSAVLTVGGVSASFQVTTLVTSPISPELIFLASPAALQVAPGTTFQSNPYTLDGFSEPLPISVSGPAGTQYCVNYDTSSGTVSTLPGSRAWTDAPGTINPGDIVRIRQLAPATNSTLQTVSMTVGGTTAQFSLVTDVAAGQDGTITFPAADPGTFTTVNDATPGTTYVSNPLTIAALGAGVAVGAYVLGGEYRKNGGAWGTAMTTVVNGDVIELRLVAPPGGGEIRKAFFRVRGNDRSFEVRNAVTRPVAVASNINWSAYGKLNLPIAPYINQARRGPSIAIGPTRDVDRAELPGAATPVYASDYFYVVPPGGGTSPVSGAALVAGETVFVCPVTGTSRTSSGTQYTRTEMRELIGADESVNWGVAPSGPIPGTHIQEGILRVTQFSTGVPINAGTCGSMARVVTTVGQIHGVDQPDIVQIRVGRSFSGSGTVCSQAAPVVTVQLQPNAAGAATSYPVSGTFQITQGSYFAYKITVESNTVRVQLARNLTSLTGTFPFGAAPADQFDTGAQPISNYTTGFYFKAGNYIQDIPFRFTGDVNDNIPAVVTNAQYSGGAEVVYRLLNVSHT